jgi:hypothetical protein
VYGEVPPVNGPEVVRVDDCPASTVVGEAAMVGPVRAALTTTATALEVAEAAGDSLSVT